jgi:transcriptional regulator with GAF, ATPase, and Fis domain
MPDQDKPKKGLDQFTKDVLYSALVSVTAKALVWTTVLLGGLMVALVVTGWKVPAWTLVAMIVVAVALMYLTRRAAGREAHELRPKLEAAENKLDRHDSYDSNLCSVLDTFQRVNTKDIKTLTMRAFIERGILIPARDVMQENGHASDLRMSVLLVAKGHFAMIWASGHHLESQEKYQVPIDQTISKVAYEKRVTQVWKNAPEEERSFVSNPKATRGFRSMVSIPILMGDETRGVFNTLTEREGAFDPADISYLTSLGSIIQLAFGMAVQELDSPATSAQKRVRRGTSRSPQKARAKLSQAAPDRGVGSSDTADGTEASDG